VPEQGADELLLITLLILQLTVPLFIQQEVGPGREGPSLQGIILPVVFLSSFRWPFSLSNGLLTKLD